MSRIGNIALDEWSEKDDTRIGTAYGCEMIRRLLLALDVNDFSEMANKMVWVLGDGESLSFKPKGIKPLAMDNSSIKPVIFDEIFQQFKDKR